MVRLLDFFKKNLKKTGVLMYSIFLCTPYLYASDWFPYQVEQIEPAFSSQGKKTYFYYFPLPHAAKKWKICVSFPHIKDDYWLGVNYGVISEVKRLGVEVNIVDAGGYDNLKIQLNQIKKCVADGAQAVLIGAISGDGLNELVSELLTKKIPVIDVVNGIYSKDITAKSLVSFVSMGQVAGEYLVKNNSVSKNALKVGWFPGPLGAAWVEAANKGFINATQNSNFTVLPPQYGDTGFSIQKKLIENILDKNPDLDYIVGTAVTAEAAVEVLKNRKIDGKVKIISFYLTPKVYAGIQKGVIVASAVDSMVIQGRIAVDQAVRSLEKQFLAKHIGPNIFMLDNKTIKKSRMDDILPPVNFKAEFSVP